LGKKIIAINTIGMLILLIQVFAIYARVCSAANKR